MRRHWRKTTIALASVAVIASAVASSAAATTEPPTSSAPASTAPAGTEPAGTEPAGTEPAGTEPAGTEPAGTAAAGTAPAGTEPAGSAPTGEALLSYDESASCGTETNTSNVAKLEAVDAQTFVLTLCNPDPAIPAKVPFASLGIAPSEYLENTEGLINEPIGTGPYMLSAWERGNQIVLEANPDYWGEPAATPTAVIQWNPESAQRLVQLQSGTATVIDNVGTNDMAAIEADANLELVPRDPLNVFYVGFNVDMEPFNDPVLREAVALGIDRQRLVDTFYPAGSEVATQFLPPAMPGYEEGFVDFEYDPETAAQMVAEAYPDGVEVDLSYRQEARGYLPQPNGDRHGHPGPARRHRHHRQPRPAGVDDADRQRQQRFAAVLPARMGRRLPGSLELLRLPLRPRQSAVRHRLPGHPRGHWRRRLGDRSRGPPHRLPADQPAARREHPDRPDRPRQLSHGVPSGSAGCPRQPVDHRDPCGDVIGGCRPVGARAERRARRPVLPRRDRRRDSAGLRADHRAAAGLRGRRRGIGPVACRELGVQRGLHGVDVPPRQTARRSTTARSSMPSTSSRATRSSGTPTTPGTSGAPATSSTGEGCSVEANAATSRTCSAAS